MNVNLGKKRNRTREDIDMSILKMCFRPKRKYKIIIRLFGQNGTAGTKHINFLLEKGLLTVIKDSRGKLFETTDRGVECCERWKNFCELYGGWKR